MMIFQYKKSAVRALNIDMCLANQAENYQFPIN